MSSPDDSVRDGSVRDYSARLDADELMDDPAISPHDLREALCQLESVNRCLGGYAPSLAGIARLRPRDMRSFTVLDVGTGGGDFPRRLSRWAARHGLRIQVTGIDLSPTTVEFARARSEAWPDVDYEVADLFDLPETRYDIVHAALALHHFNGEAATRALRKMFSISRWGVVVNDLHRHPLAYHSFRMLSSLFWRNRLIRHDGPISVLRGFRRGDWIRLTKKLDAPRVEIRWKWAFRWQVVIPK